VQLLLELLSIAAVLHALAVISAKSPVTSVLCLIGVFISAALALALLGGVFLGLVYVIVYVGAIAILFLFVVLMLNVRAEELVDVGRGYRKSLPLAAALSLALLWEVGSLLAVGPGLVSPLALLNGLNGLSTGGSPVTEVGLPLFGAPLAQAAPFLQVEALGMVLYGPAAIWLIIAALVFVLAMYGPISLCMDRRSGDVR
jgi:NADH-ubiquinone oxidoreductase chain 6